MGKWDGVSDSFHKWWEEFSNNPEEFDEETLHQDACIEAFNVGYNLGYTNGGENMKESMWDAGYELPPGRPED